MKNLLEIKNLSVAYDRKTVVKDCSFSVAKGEIVVVLGASGEGKTSLLKAIAGLLPHQAGEVIYKGEEVKDASRQLVPGHADIRLVNQDFGLDRFHTVEENLRLKLLPYDETYRQARIDTLLRLMKLTPYRGEKVTALSGGQQQRLSIARALAGEPGLLLMDEPFNQLDFQNKVAVEKHIRNYIRKNKIAVILVTHNGVEAMEWADRIVFMRNGKIRRIDRPQEFYERPRNRFEAGFFGDINHLKVEGRDVYFRPGVFSLTRKKAFPQKLKITYRRQLPLGWYSEYTFSFEGQSFRLFSQDPIADISEIFIQPIVFK